MFKISLYNSDTSVIFIDDEYIIVAKSANWNRTTSILDHGITHLALHVCWH